MCFVSKKVRKMAMSESKVDLYNEYETSEENCKRLLYAGQDKTLKKEIRKNNLLKKALKYQNSKSYTKKISKHTR